MTDEQNAIHTAIDHFDNMIIKKKEIEDHSEMIGRLLWSRCVRIKDTTTVGRIVNIQIHKDQVSVCLKRRYHKQGDMVRWENLKDVELISEESLMTPSVEHNIVEWPYDLQVE